MAENLTIARPYAQAVFEIARDKDCFDKWSQALEAITCAVLNPQFQNVLKDARSSNGAASLMIELLGDLLDEEGQNLVRILAENDRFEVIPEIYQEFVRLRDDYKKVQAVEIISARPLSKADEKALVAKLEQKYQTKISLTRTIDPSIIGGVIIKVGDEVIDGSVKSSLDSLSTTLK